MLVVLLFAGCSEPSNEATVSAHPWVKAPVAGDDRAVTLPAWLIYPVDAARLDEAVRELAAEPYIQLSPGLARHYTGTEVRVPAEMRPFLVRAVAAPDATVTVIQSMAGLWMRAARTGQVATAAPRVVLLDPTPREIFITVE